MVTVAPALIKRCKTHFHNLECGASIILGNNGYIWIAPLSKQDQENKTKSDDIIDSAPLTVSQVRLLQKYLRIHDAVNP